MGTLRRWVRADLANDAGYYDQRKTALDIVRSGPPEPYDVERVEEAIRRVEVEGEALALSVLEEAKTAGERLDAAKLRWAEAQVDTVTAIQLMGYLMGKPRGQWQRDKIEAAREVFHGAKTAVTEAWKQWQACQ